MIAGSVTGGVGTATLPAVIRQFGPLRQTGRMKIAAVLQLPWFTLKKIEGEPRSENPDVTDAMMDRNSACLVQGYLTQLLSKQLDNVVFLGLPHKVDRVSHGGARQGETHHFLNIISGLHALCLLDSAESERKFSDGRLTGTSLGDNPAHHYLGGATGPAFKHFNVSRLMTTARCLYAFTEAMCFELTTLRPTLSHQSDVHALLSALEEPQRNEFRAALLDFHSLHTEILEWLVSSLESRVGEGRADAGLHAFEPDSRLGETKRWEALRRKVGLIRFRGRFSYAA